MLSRYALARDVFKAVIEQTTLNNHFCTGLPVVLYDDLLRFRLFPVTYILVSFFMQTAKILWCLPTLYFSALLVLTKKN